MKDPERLLSPRGDADEFERELLGSLRGGDPPAGARAEAWQKIGSQVAALGLIGGAAGSAPPNAGGTGIAAAVAKASATKLAIAIAATAVVFGAGAAVVHRRAASAEVAVPSVSVGPVMSESPAPEPQSTLTVPTVVVASPSRGTPSASAGSKVSAEGAASHGLAAESALLTRARAELVGGDPRAAESTLARMQAEFPRGVLSQEREVVAIEALAADGKSDAAARRARAFIAAHPESPHSTQLGRFLEGP
jgi:hypothetical protein